MPNKLIGFHNGLVTSRDPSTLKEGELVEAVGCEYREGATHIFKQPGRASCNTNSTPTFAKSDVKGRVKGIHHLQYDQGTDKLALYADLAAGGAAIYDLAVFTTSSTAGAVGTAQVTGLTAGKIPSFASLQDRWIMVNGADANRIREPQNVPSGSVAWRLLGMQKPDEALTLGAAPSVAGQSVALDSFTPGPNTDYNAPSAVGDGYDFTSAVGVQNEAGTKVHNWTWTADFSEPPTVTTGVIHIRHAATVNTYEGSTPRRGSGIVAQGSQTISVVASPGTTNYSITNAAPYAPTVTTVDIGSDNLQDITITATTTNDYSFPGGEESKIRGQIFEIYATNQAAEEVFTTGTLYYGYTERYVDSDDIAHESNMSQLTEVAAQSGVYGITLEGFPASPVNSFTTEYVLYRSLDEDGGGFPYMYEIAKIPIGTTSYVDTGEISFTDITQQLSIYNTTNILYPDGSIFPMEVNGVPPTSKKVIVFQGSMVYVPVESNRIQYSQPAAISPTAIEQVPELYYLEFATPQNDIVVGVELGNSGRSLIVYFERYSMLVNFLPQATDPGVFDQRITEYVSNTRGAAGTHATSEVTMSNGRTFAVAADSLGLWATDGVTSIEEWSNDIDWTALMDTTTFATMQLINNPLMDRLELLYDSDGSQTMRELHFYYGRMKDDGEGNQVPLITGPHQASSDATDGWACKHYSSVNSKWVGWSGDNAATATDGDIYVERETDADASLAYDSTNTYVPFQVKTGDMYLGGLGESAIVGFGYPKFGVKGGVNGTTSTKTLDPVASSSLQGLFGTFRRDGNSAASTKNKPFIIGTQRKVYWHMYSDRHNIQIKDISSTALPELIAYEIEIRSSGKGRDK